MGDPRFFNVEFLESPKKMKKGDLEKIIEHCIKETHRSASCAIPPEGETLQSAGAIGFIKLGFLREYAYSASWRIAEDKYLIQLQRVPILRTLKYMLRDWYRDNRELVNLFIWMGIAIFVMGLLIGLRGLK
jgi:hypothetical protein